MPTADSSKWMMPFVYGMGDRAYALWGEGGLGALNFDAIGNVYVCACA